MKLLPPALTINLRPSQIGSFFCSSSHRCLTMSAPRRWVVDPTNPTRSMLQALFFGALRFFEQRDHFIRSIASDVLLKICLAQIGDKQFSHEPREVGAVGKSRVVLRLFVELGIDGDVGALSSQDWCFFGLV